MRLAKMDARRVSQMRNQADQVYEAIENLQVDSVAFRTIVENVIPPAENFLKS